MGMLEQFHAVIPAGGSGTRLWPISRTASPKFLHDMLGNGSSLLQGTWDRLDGLVGDEHRWVVTGTRHAAAVQQQLPNLSPQRLIAEPAPRDSAAAIGLAALLIQRTSPGAVVGSFSADHSVTNAAEFRSVIRQAVAAAQGGDLVTVGITPTYPATSFGYIKTGELLSLPGAPTARRALEFVEKPEAPLARKYAYSGSYRWNAGMFIMRVEPMLELFAQQAPDLFAGISAIAQAWDTPGRDEVMAEVWDALAAPAFDYVVAEPAADAGRVVVIPGDFGWDDVGDFDSVAKLRQPVPGEDRRVVNLGQDVDIIDVDSTGMVISATGKPVALVGLNDVVVVDLEDVLLVTNRSASQAVKKAVPRAIGLGLHDLL